MSGAAIVQPALPRMQLNLIRDFEVRRDGIPVHVPPCSQRLVGFLAFQDGPVRRVQVSGALWQDSDEHHAGASLRSAIWRLQPLELVNSSGTHLWLNPKIEVDLRTVIGTARSVLREQLCEDAALAAAWGLIDAGEDLLPGWYDDWVLVERERLRQLRLHALDRIGDRLLESGRWCEALQAGLAATRTEPLRESAHRLLVRVHLAQGNTAEAVRQYRLYADLLRTELDGRPSPAIRDLLVPVLRRASTPAGEDLDARRPCPPGRAGAPSGFASLS